MPDQLPLPPWHRLGDGWHVAVIHGAHKTRCGKHIPADGETRQHSMPTHCDSCRKHYSQLRKART